MSSSLEQIIELLDEALKHRPQPPVMTSRWRSQDSAGDVSARDQVDMTKSGMTDSLFPASTFYDDSLRPKSFLHDEVDEFNRILGELLRSRQRAEPAAEEDDLVCCSSLSQDIKDDDFLMTQRDRRRTNSSVVNSDFETHDTSDAQHNYALDSQASITHRTAQCGDDEREVVDEDGDDVLSIVEEDDCHPAEKDCNIHSSHNIFADDLFKEDDADSGYQSGNSTMIGPRQVSTHDVSARCQLIYRVDCYNVNCRHTGLTMTIAPDSDVFQGFIRVHMNLHKPISMAMTSSCVHDVTSVPGAGIAGFADVATETESFYLPPNTSKVIHITSEMRTAGVIQTLLDKFLITDSCQKFALYEKINYEHPKTPEERRLNGMLRRLSDDEKPLQLCLRWSDDGADSLSRRQFVLQDNVTSEIAWDSFSLPELEAFLRILDREEESYCNEIQLKYGAKKRAAEMRLKQLADDNASSA